MSPQQSPISRALRSRRPKSSQDVPRRPGGNRGIHEDVPMKVPQMGDFWDGAGTSSSPLCVSPMSRGGWVAVDGGWGAAA
jgi:hypothetical protein